MDSDELDNYAVQIWAPLRDCYPKTFAIEMILLIDAYALILDIYMYGSHTLYGIPDGN